MPAENVNDLLEELRTLSGLSYFSDLHDVAQRAYVLEAVKRVPPNRYGSDVWSEVYAYIICDQDTASPDNGYRRLLSRLEALCRT